MEEKKISVIIPVYNTEQYLKRCLDSIKENTYQYLEIICINDGSTDNSLEILEQYQKDDSRFIIIDQKNSGVSKARNNGLEKATGDYIAFIDSDDWINPKYFEKLIRCAEENNAELVICHYREYEKFCKQKEIEDEIKISNIKAEQFFGQSVSSWMRAYVWGKLYSKEIIKEKKFATDLSVMEDNLFNIDVVAASLHGKITIIKQPLYYRINREESLSKSLDGEEWIDLSITFVEKVLNIVDNTNEASKKFLLYESFKKSLRLRYHVMFYPKGSKVKKLASNVLEKIYLKIKELNNITWKEKIYYYLLLKMPIIYRMYLISSDKSILEWEKRKKMRQKEQ
jgi:glycosyltransferase involved in cell wall biosynthesis